MPTPVSSTRAHAPFSSAPERQLDRAALRGVRDRVGHQVGQHPHQRAVTADHPHRVGRADRRAARRRPLGGDAVRGQHVVDDLVERHLVEGGLDRARVDLRHLEQVVDHLGQPDRSPARCAWRGCGLRRRRTTPSAMASETARIPASGVRRSWLTKATSRRRDARRRARSRGSPAPTRCGGPGSGPS